MNTEIPDTLVADNGNFRLDPSSVTSSMEMIPSLGKYRCGVSERASYTDEPSGNATGSKSSSSVRSV